MPNRYELLTRFDKVARDNAQTKSDFREESIVDRPPQLENVARLGKDNPTKTDEFLEKFQTAFDPPPLIFGKSYCAFRDKIATKVRMFSMAGLLCII